MADRYIMYAMAYTKDSLICELDESEVYLVGVMLDLNEVCLIQASHLGPDYTLLVFNNNERVTIKKPFKETKETYLKTVRTV